MNRFILAVLISLTAFSCTKSKWEQTDDAVIVYPQQAGTQQVKAIKITPVHDEIIKVSASATKTFSEKESLIALPQNETVPFVVEEMDDQLIISTAKTKVEVSTVTGEIDFFDENGNPILLEKENGGKSFEPIEVDGVSAYSTRQVFESSDSEAIYGLGQHQADEMNYKGKNEELFQYNTKVSVPFIVSTKNYGLLWDNYSLSRFGDPRPYSQIDQFKLFDAEGNEGGLTATYIDNNENDHVYTSRVESTIDYENLETIENFPEGFDFNHARIVWEGDIQPEESGIFRFLLYYAGYTKIWVNGVLMADKWRTAWNPSVAKFQYDMKAGEKYHVKLDWIPDGGVSYIGLKALSPVDPELQNNISFYSEMGDQIDYFLYEREQHG